jgi:predicted metal-binding protein
VNDKKIIEISHELGFDTCLPFNPAILTTEQEVRQSCENNKCGNYGKNLMCPPHIGSLHETAEFLSQFKGAFILRWSKYLDVKNDHPGIESSKRQFHKMVLKLEALTAEAGYKKPYGLIAGNCTLCDPCGAVSGIPCPHPEKARPSLESLGVSVSALLATLNLDAGFNPDRVTWTGCLLFR